MGHDPTDELEEVLSSLEGVVDGDEPVDELSHALQCARNAMVAGAASSLVVASLFHDVARSPLVAAQYPDLPHEAAGARWLEPRFGARVAWLAGAHVAAKLFLLEHQIGYSEVLTVESTRSSVSQRADSSLLPIEHPWWPDAVRLRRWDDHAKDPQLDRIELAEPLRIARSVLARQSIRI